MFYFDESFHDQKITVSAEGKVNIRSENALDTYVGLFWGCEEKDLERNLKLLSDFEKKQKAMFGLKEDHELKSTTIAKSNFKYGIRSFNKNTMSFYKDLFSVIHDINPIIQIDCISKTEFFVINAFKDFQIRTPGVDEDAFYYALTKFLIIYGNNDLFRSLCDVHDRETAHRLKDELIFNLDCILRETEHIKRKEMEHSAYCKIRRILIDADFSIDTDSKYDFRYYPNFDGLL